jgi:hypothetical protein
MLKSTARELWGDESGFIVSTDLILISSILVIGLLVGLVSVRDQIVQELGDMAVAVGNLNQSYSFAGHNVTLMLNEGDPDEQIYVFTVAGSSFADASDFGENGSDEANTDPPGQEPAGIEVSIGATSEG